jgi:MraZ protein
MLLTGNFRRLLDDKFRFAIPKPLRDAIGPEVQTLVVTPGTDGSLNMYTESIFAAVGASLAESSPAAREQRVFCRLFYSQAQQVEIDRQSRVRLTDDLIQFAGLKTELVLVGVRDHIEVWDAERWSLFIERHQADFDEWAERAFATPGLSASSKEQVATEANFANAREVSMPSHPR